ncbi:hypothetical protein BGZ68_003790 [Mortierella alpina]|nr:hypothetical protein BGZ68_003790 [Mortierella alpina]
MAFSATKEKEFNYVFLGGVALGVGKKLKYEKAVSHPEYYQTASVNDIAVAFLPEKADGPYASIEGTSYPDEGSKLTVAGYGSESMNYDLVAALSTFHYTDGFLFEISDTSANGTSTDHLLKVQVTMGSKVECATRKNTQDRFFDPNAQVCATDNGYSACKGDSGGPLYSGTGKDLHIVGVVSGSGKETRCGEKGTFQYYTFVKPFISWINSEIEKFEKNGAESTVETDTSMSLAIFPHE